MDFNMSEIDIQNNILSTIINMLIARKWIDDDFEKYERIIKNVLSNHKYGLLILRV